MRIVQGLYKIEIFGEEIPYLLNPSKEEMLAFMKKVWAPAAVAFAMRSDHPVKVSEEEKHLKGVLDTGGPGMLYIFNPLHTIHHWDFIQHMGIARRPDERPYAVSLVLTKKYVDVDVYEKDYPEEFDYERFLMEPVRKSKLLKNIYGPNFEPELDFHPYDEW